MATELDFGLQLCKLLGGLSLVLALLLGSNYAWKRWGQGSTQEEEAFIQVVEKRTLGPRTQLIVVRVQDELLVLGLSPQGLQFLSKLETASKNLRPAAFGLPAS